MSGERECPLCGTRLQDDATECSTCGERFEAPQAQDAPSEEVECPSCMSLVPAGVDDCPICGEKLAPVEASSPEAIVETAVEEASAPQAKECPECGSLSENEAIECPVCGFKFEYEGLSLPVQEAPAEQEVPEMAVEKPLAPVPVPKTFARVEPVVAPPVKKQVPVPPPEAPQQEYKPEKRLRCPACNENIKAGDKACPLCGAVLSEYVVVCPACRAEVPAIDEVCPECFATLREAGATEPVVGLSGKVAVEEIVVSGAAAEAAQESVEGRACLVCSAVLEETADSCPVCRQPYGSTLPPELEVEQHWEGIGIEIPKEYFKCPNCEAVLSDTEPRDCEVAERKWFYRAIIALFTGIFISSASIWVRGVTIEAKTQGLSPLPMDAVVNILGWIFVVIGFVFWIFSWRAAESVKLCPSCGCDVKKDAKECSECGECFEFLEGQGLNGVDVRAEEEA